MKSQEGNSVAGVESAKPADVAGVAFWHTPGPWRVQGNAVVSTEAFHTNGHKRNTAGISRASYSDCVCHIYGCMAEPLDDLDPVQPAANARLIAAAPDLLNALTVLANAAEARGIPVDAARAAIRKATGAA